MSEMPIISWCALLVAMFLCHFISGRFVRILPWANGANDSRVPFFFGAAIAPFLLGFITIAALKLLPGKSHNAHLIFIFSSLCFFCLLSCKRTFKPTSDMLVNPQLSQQYSWDEKLSIALLTGFVIFLVASSLSVPLTQTDALEYAQMGRIVFDNRTLDSYPPIVPDNHPSGFYSPVTHPPLYVALVYTAYLMQGNADTPSLMRLISPWCLLVATGVIFSLGSMINRRTGLFASLLFISTPLLFMGTVSSLIDPLSVLGFTLVFASIFSFSASPLKIGLLQGSILGIAFWVHSQAILFPFLLIAGLVFYNGIGRWRQIANQISVLIPVSIAIGIWPYWNNYQKLGSFISDNPIIFRLPNLVWNDYFLIGRGVDNLSAQLQYGLFKGWFAPEAYGILFWLMTAGFVCMVKPSLSGIRKFVTGNVITGGNDNIKNILLAAAGVILLYHLGILLAIFLGVNQIIRIERYMLILVPCVALLSGFALARFFEAGERVKPFRVFAGGILFLLLAQLLIFYLQDRARGENPQLYAMEYIREKLPENSVIYATLSADMYYADRKMVGNLDPSLIEFYQEMNPERGWKILRKLGITHIYVVPNAQPTFYNSTMQQIVADNRFTTLLYSNAGSQIYKINDKLSPVKLKTDLDLIAPDIRWQNTRMLLIGGRKALAEIALFSEPLDGAIESEIKLPLSVFQRDTASLLRTDNITVSESTEYKIDLNISGYGLLRFWITQYDGQGNILNGKYILSETILSNTYPKRDFAYRFKTLQKTKYLKIGIEHYGNSQVKIGRAHLESF